MIIKGNHLKAEDGYKLYNRSNGIISKSVFLGKYSTQDSWKEITDAEALKIEEKQDLETIRNILLADREEAVID